MIHSVKIYGTKVTIGDLADFLAEAERMGAKREDEVRIAVAPTGNQMDPGGEITIEITVRDP